jgi:hypothetical protein
MQDGKERDAQASETREYTTFPMLLMGEEKKRSRPKYTLAKNQRIHTLQDAI